MPEYPVRAGIPAGDFAGRCLAENRVVRRLDDRSQKSGFVGELRKLPRIRRVRGGAPGSRLGMFLPLVQK